MTRYLSLAGSSAATFLVSGYAALIGGASLHCHRTLAGVHPNAMWSVSSDDHRFVSGQGDTMIDTIK